MDVIFGWFGQLVDTTVSGLQNDACFRTGFSTAMQWGMVVGLLYILFKFMKYVVDRISQFFKPTKTKVTINGPDGPSPFSSLAQMVGALVLIAVMVFAIYSVATAS